MANASAVIVEDSPVAPPGPGGDDPASSSASDCTQVKAMDEDVEHGLRLDPDMRAYAANMTEQEMQAFNIRADGEMYHKLVEILRRSRETEGSVMKETTAWYTESTKPGVSQTWPEELWKMTHNDDRKNDGAWEIGLCRSAQILALLQEFSSTELLSFTEGTLFEMAELYNDLILQLGGQSSHRFPPGAHFGLKMMSEHLTDTEIKDMTDLCGTTTAADYHEWSAVMGKYTNDSYPKEAFSYEDVATRWAGCWSHDFSGPPPVRVLVLGTSTMLDHKVDATEFRGLMLEKFDFAASAADGSELLVEFFEDNYDNKEATVVNLMKT